MHKVAVSYVLVVTAVGCGSEGPMTPAMSAADARLSVDGIDKISKAMTAMDAAAVADGLLAAGAANLRIVGDVPDAHDFPDEIPRGTPADVGGVASCTAMSCVFTGYGLITPVNYRIWKLDGTVSHSGDTTTFDVTGSFVNHLERASWVIDGSVTTTAARVDGTLHSHGTKHNAAALEWTRDVAVGYDAIALDAQGCPIGGSLSVASSLDDVDDTRSFDLEGSMPFGPACSSR